jgi:tetratricopeptide (TPR) repeat protein
MKFRRDWALGIWAVTCALVAWPAPVCANAESARLRARAYELAYNLDYDAATREMEAAVKADPTDPAAERGLAMIPWLLISFSRGAVTVDDYLGNISRQNVALRQPPADLAARFHHHANRSLMLAEAHLARQPRDPDALYELGNAVGLQASYAATVDGKILGAFRSARRAYDAHEQVLALAPSRKDAGLIVGMYRYVISAMSFPIRMMAYVAGFGGDKDKGIRMVEDAAAGGGTVAADARFALVLLYNRERRFADAMRVLAELRAEFPRNRILWLESGATALRAGRLDEAERLLSDGIARLATDARPRMHGEEALWMLKRGATRVALNRLPDAEADLTRGATLEARGWVTGRIHAELGKVADLRQDRAAARRHFQRALMLAEQDNDAPGAEAARRWVNAPWVNAAIRRER